MTYLILDSQSALYPELSNYEKGEREGAVRLTTAAAKSLQSCPTLCNPIDGSSPGSPVHGIFQARLLESVAISFSSGSSPPRDRTSGSPAL